MRQRLRRVLFVMLAGLLLYGAFVLWRDTKKIADVLGTFHWWSFGAACAFAFIPRTCPTIHIRMRASLCSGIASASPTKETCVFAWFLAIGLLWTATARGARWFA